MLVKSGLAGLAAAALVSTPVVIPFASGTPITLSLGPVSLHAARSGVHVELEPDCYAGPCPLAELRLGGDEARVYKLTL